MLSNPQSLGAKPGLVLKAWALVAANGTLIKGFNVTSITKGGTGLYTLNITNALATTTAQLDWVGYGKDGSHAPPTQPPSIMQNSNNTTSAMSYTTYHNGAAADLQHYVGVYE